MLANTLLFVGPPDFELARRAFPSKWPKRTGWLQIQEAASPHGKLIVIGAKMRRSVPAGLVAGLVVGAFLAFLVAAMPQPDGTHYYWEIMLPGSVLGLIVGYATQRYGRRPDPSARREARV